MFASPLYPDPTAAPAEASSSSARPPTDKIMALRRLRDGNDRFATGASTYGRRAAPLAPGVELRPCAAVVSCVDARVPVEAIFDQDIGSIVVVRSAAHVLDRAVLGSVEFAVTDLGVPLVVVLGHEDCRAIVAAIEAVRTRRRASGARGFLVDEIAPAVVTDDGAGGGASGSGAGGGGADDGAGGAALAKTTAEHVRRTVARLAEAPYVREAVKDGRVEVVGGVYRLATGRVDLL